MKTMTGFLPKSDHRGLVHLLTGSDTISVRPEPFASVRPERSEAESKDAQDRLHAAKSKAGKPAIIALFDFVAGVATLRANGKSIAQQLRYCANVMCFDLAFPVDLSSVADLDHENKQNLLLDFV
jgi:hypothetical protein